MRQENETKLTDLKDKQSDLEATIKSHTHEKDVFEDANTNYRQQIDTINNQRTALQQEKRKYYTTVNSFLFLIPLNLIFILELITDENFIAYGLRW